MQSHGKLGLWQSDESLLVLHSAAVAICAVCLLHTKGIAQPRFRWPWILGVFFLVVIFFGMPIWRGRVGWSYPVLGGATAMSLDGFAVIVVIELIRGRL